MVEVFKTDVNSIEKAKYIHELLISKFPDILFNFDLEDCDRILRAEYNSPHFEVDEVIKLLRRENHAAETLPDETTDCNRLS
jgi:hypothetical protein